MNRLCNNSSHRNKKHSPAVPLFKSSDAQTLLFPRWCNFFSIRSAVCVYLFPKFHLAIKITRRHRDAPWLAQGYPPERVYIYIYFIFHYYVFFFCCELGTHTRRETKSPAGKLTRQNKSPKNSNHQKELVYEDAKAEKMMLLCITLRNLQCSTITRGRGLFFYIPLLFIIT